MVVATVLLEFVVVVVVMGNTNIVGAFSAPTIRGLMMIQLNVSDFDMVEKFNEKDVIRHLKKCWIGAYKDVPGDVHVNKMIDCLENEGLKFIKPQDATMLVVGNEKILGTLVYSKRDVVYFWGMYIDPDHIGKGIGKYLLDFFQSELDQGVVIKAYVLEEKLKARRFYKNNGFCERSKDYLDVFCGKNMPAILIEKRLG